MSNGLQDAAAARRDEILKGGAGAELLSLAVAYLQAPGSACPAWLANEMDRRLTSWESWNEIGLDDAFGVSRPRGKRGLALAKRKRLEWPVAEFMSCHVLGGSMNVACARQAAAEKFNISEAQAKRFYDLFKEQFRLR